MQILVYRNVTTLTGLTTNNPLTLLLLLIGAALFLFFIYAFITSIKEHEKRAANLLMLFGIVLLVPVIFLLLSSFQLSEIVGWILITLYVLIPLLLFLPIDKRKWPKPAKPKGRIDERDVMFSRNHYIPGSERYNAYYSKYPEKEILDNKFREKPGLLQTGSSFYHPFYFNAAKSSFDTIAAFRPLAKGEPAKNQTAISPGEATAYIKKWAVKLGAEDVGITLLKDYHKYSVVGRGQDYGKTVELNHKFAIAFIVEMDKEMIDTAPHAPTVLETSQQYLEVGKVAVQVAAVIRRLGYEARAHIDGDYRVVCPLVARDANLGEIGRMGILMTPKYGPRVRISVVTTDIPLITDRKKTDPTVDEFCRICKKCAHTCPGQAISFSDPGEIDGVKRWQINQEKCFTYWCQAGTDCGKCLAVCPYSHPDNLFHNIIRYGIRRNFLFRKIAVAMDDLFYGKRPKAKEEPEKVRV
jgi:reductive dehalogenase